MARSISLGEERQVRLLDGVVHYRERGEGDPLVFVHGLVADADLWGEVVPRLAGRARCIAPDLPLGAHAEPMARSADLSPPGLADLIVEFLDALEVERPTLVANDTGTAIAQVLVARHPRRLGRLVLTPGDAFENFFPPAFRPLQAAARLPGSLLGVANALRAGPLRDLPNAYGRLAKHGVPRELTRAWTEPLRRDRGVRRDAAKVLRGAGPKHTLDAAAQLSRFDGPALVAWAPEDRFFPWDHAERLATILPDAPLEPIADSWTYVPLDQPARLAELIGDFVEETRAAGRAASA